MNLVRSFAFLPATLVLTALAGCTFSLGDPGAGGAGGDSFGPTDCGQGSSCPVGQECLATVENHGSPQFGMRVAELTVATPVVFSNNGLLGGMLSQWFGPSVPGCSATASGLGNGSGASSWLLGFDLGKGTLTMGGATPPADPAEGYAFLDTMVSQGTQTYHAAPITFGLVTNADGSLDVAAPQNLDLPMFFPGDTGMPPTGPVVLPLRRLTASHVVVSPSHDCIGRYDPADIETSTLCSPTNGNQLYFHGGHLEAYVTLEEADSISMGALDMTLCVLLAGPNSQDNDRAQPLAHCTRTNGAIDFKGDWCSQSDAPATATCADAVHFTADFAASAAVIHP